MAIGIIVLCCIGVVMVAGTISVLREDKAKRDIIRKIGEVLAVMSKEDLKKIIEQVSENGKNN